VTSQTQRSLLLAFIGSVVCFALAGIYCLLVGHMGDREERILGTTATFLGASIFGLAAALPWERRRWHPIGLAGLVVVAMATVLIVFAIWYEPHWNAYRWYYKIMFSSCVMAVALPLVGLLSLARLRRSFEWVRIATVIAVALLAGQACMMIVGELDSDEMLRLLGVLAILAGAGTLAVPILHRVSNIRMRDEIQTASLVMSVTCPRCSKSQQLAVGRSRCAGCGLKIHIEIEEEHCPKCGYPLYKLESAVCPECGTPVYRQEVVAQQQQ
jgi:hypothetical protein